MRSLLIVASPQHMAKGVMQQYQTRHFSQTSSVLQSCSVLQCIAVYCSVLQCIAVYCSVLLCVAVCCSPTNSLHSKHSMQSKTCGIACIHTHTHTHTHMHTYTHTYTHKQCRTHTHTHTHTHNEYHQIANLRYAHSWP